MPRTGGSGTKPLARQGLNLVLYEKEERKSQEGKSGEEEQVWVKGAEGHWAGAARGRQRVLPTVGGGTPGKPRFPGAGGPAEVQQSVSWGKKKIKKRKKNLL